MKYLGWIAVGFLTVLGAMVAFRLFNRRPRVDTAKLDGRQPGFIDNLLQGVQGVFGRGNTAETVPPIVGGYGVVGVPGTPQFATSAYDSVPSDTRVPTFLEGSTGGVADGAMPGSAPPMNRGIPGAVGTRATSAEYAALQEYYASKNLTLLPLN